MSIVPISTGNPIDSNIWLVTGSENILIDTGTGETSGGTDYAASLAWSIDLHLEGRGLSAIVLTHCHIDHVGGAAGLKEHYGCPVYIGAKDYDAVSAGDSMYTVSGMFRIPFCPLDCIPVDEGHVFDIGDHRLRVIDTPGHTAGGICLFDEVTGALFSGDTLFANGIGRTDLPGGSLQELVQSLVKLSNVNITAVYPGHGPVGYDGKETLDYALRMVGNR